MTLAVGIYQPKSSLEVSKMRRIARIYDADMTFQIGGVRSPDLAPGIPHERFSDLEDFEVASQHASVSVLEIDTHAVPLGKFQHPEDGVYLIGPENGTIPHHVLDRLGRIIEVETPIHGIFSPSTALAVVLHDRYVTLTQKAVA